MKQTAVDMDTFSLLEALESFERGRVSYYEEGEDPILYHRGVLPAILSAPHGSQHMRHGRWKGQDGYTAALAHYVAQVTGAHALCVVRRIDPDPNYYDDSVYKHRLRDIVRGENTSVDEAKMKLLIDLHGVGSQRPFGVELGTMSGASCPDYEEHIIRILEEMGWSRDAPEPLRRLRVNEDFTAGNQATVTRYARQKLGINAAQLELNAYCRIPRSRGDFEARPELVAAVVGALIRIVSLVGG